MEIVTKQLEMNRMGRIVTNQFLVDEDYNVPDSKRDIKKIVMSEGNLKIDQIKPAENYLHISGKIEFQMLYETDSLDTSFSCIGGSLPFQEMIFLEEGAGEHYQIKQCEVEVKTHLINSRKFRVKAVAEIGVQSEQQIREEIPVDVDCGEGVYKKQEKRELLKLYTSKYDIYRIKQELLLPGTKESLGTILWKDVVNCKLETRLQQDEIRISGECLVFCFYESPEGKLDWIEEAVPYSGKLDCAGVHEGMYHRMQWNLEDVKLEIRMDEDGETRVLGVEGTLKMTLAVYEEEPVNVLLDLYSLEKNCILTTEEVLCESLLLQNHSKCKIMERLTVPELKMDVLQICHSTGRILIEDTEKREDGIWVTGVLYVNFLYVKSNDETPFDVWSGMIPFSHLVECDCEAQDVKYDVTAMLEQLSITLQGGNEIEVKAVLSFRGFFRREESIRKISRIEEESLSEAELEEQPGIVGYIVKEGEELWDLAKRYRTSVKTICEMNHLSEGNVNKGERLLIFRENMSIL